VKENNGKDKEKREGKTTERDVQQKRKSVLLHKAAQAEKRYRIGRKGKKTRHH